MAQPQPPRFRLPDDFAKAGEALRRVIDAYQPDEVARRRLNDVVRASVEALGENLKELSGRFQELVREVTPGNWDGLAGDAHGD